MSDNSKTVHAFSTPHGYDTPHQYPFDSSGELEVLKGLSVQLYPTGRAWYKSEGGVFEKLHEAINLSIFRLINDGRLLLDGLFPDNENFTIDDARLWEYRLGLITNESLDLQLRKSAIRRKLGHPNNVKARQHPLFIQSQLQLAGFNVWVHENTVPYRSPADILSVSLGNVFHGEPTQHGNATFHGGDSYSSIANNISQVESYAIGGDENLWATFFIGGEILGDMASVPSTRLREFKELVIKLKPAHTVAFTFINYT